MHPGYYRFNSALFYDSKLHGVPNARRQNVTSTGCSGTGLRDVSVSHTGNQSAPSKRPSCRAIVTSLLSSGRMDRQGQQNGGAAALRHYIIAPYNGRLLKSARIPGAQCRHR